MANGWREAGIRRVLIPKPLYLPSQRALKNFCSVINAVEIDTQTTDGNARALLDRIGQDGSSTAVAFMDQQGADALCNEDPQVIEQILQISRVAFCRGP